MPAGKSFFSIADIDLIDFARLISQLPRRPVWNPFSTQGQYVRAILESEQILRDNNINTALRLAHFFGQGLVETNFLSARAENLNYSFEGLKRTFGRKFANDDEIRSYARNPERIANRVYANRLGNGPEESGDGWRYRGRGFFQLTGKDNYRRYGELAGVDLVNDPELIERDLKASIQVAAAYFNRTGLGEFADRNDIAGVSRGVNRGDPRASAPAIGEAERIEWTTRALSLVRDPNSIVLQGGQTNPQQPGPPVTQTGDLTIGSTGQAVQDLQRKLNALGYAIETDDGVYGPVTQRAVLAFQHDHGLPATGLADQATRDAVNQAFETNANPQPHNPDIPQTPAPQPPPGQLPQPSEPTRPPVTQSGTFWGAILAAIAGFVEFLRATVAQVAAAFPVLQTPYGPFNTIWILAALLLIGIAIVIWALFNRRKKGKA